MTIVLPLIVLLIGGIALPGAAVYIDRRQLRNRFWQSLVSLAGPAANILCLLALALAFNLVPNADPTNWLWSGLAALALFQTVAILLNLLPIPPLDGYGVIEPWLPNSIRAAAANFSRIGFLLLFAAFWVFKPVGQMLWNVADVVVLLLNIPSDAINYGLHTFSKYSFVLVIGFLVIYVIARQLKRTGATGK